MPGRLRPLLAALAASLLLHLLPLIDGWAKRPSAQVPTTPPLQARLNLPAPPPATPELMLPEPQPQAAVKPAASSVPEKPAGRKYRAKTGSWTEAVSEQFSAQQREGLFYPEEAIRRGLEGEALVLLMLDENGQVVAARIEESSGHPLLDEAALRAVRRLRSLPADAPTESLLPVRFRLR